MEYANIVRVNSYHLVVGVCFLKEGVIQLNVLAVGIGGFFGALLRYLMGEWIHTTNGFPLGTLFINLLGCFFLAWFFTVTTQKWNMNPSIKLAIGTGFTGAFTTFSTFSVETLQLINLHQFAFGFLYVLVSVFGGIGLALLGAKLAAGKAQQEGESR